ncbi:MAG TPA: efflux RND transporter periplasmic adaptor subunit [Candidatus Competibacter sp.]|nr:efflux RND transporter periplasmic adaptor subunit [Candidatus Competibacteraceae bacterium]HPE71559.1 efflux RND transporter periplasmic adaptor subunit [Candidatus Competibacter sp.]
MSYTPSVQDAELAKIIGSEPARGRFGVLRWLIAAFAFALVTGGFLFFQSGPTTDPALQYQTEPLRRGDLRVTVSATGKLAPVNQVDVGSELSGTIETVLVDYNDRVKKGQALAHLDVAKLQDAIAKAKAALASTEAKVLQTAATIKESRANLRRLRQVAKLSGGKVPAPTELETAEAAVERAIADEASAQAAIEEARATLRSNQTDLAKASIRSPIDGVVLSRQVEPGQTVAASLQAPVLFTLAENLAQMELQVDVDEADVGQVREGQSATFSVDAYPNRNYPARIGLVRFGAETVNNVVTYKTILNVNNDDLSLRPGMTATAEIVTTERANVLLVPNAALRFTPPQPAEAESKSGGGLLASLLPRPPRSLTQRRRPTNAKDTRSAARRIWILRGGQPVAVPVTVGSSDGRMTEVMSEGLEPDLLVITAHSGVAR